MLSAHTMFVQSQRMFETGGLCQTVICVFLCTSFMSRLAHWARGESSPEILKNMQEMRFVISNDCGLRGVLMREVKWQVFTTRLTDKFGFLSKCFCDTNLEVYLCVCARVCLSFVNQLQCARSIPLDAASKLRASIVNIIFMPSDGLDSRHWASKAT